MRGAEFPCIGRELIAQKEAVEEAGGKHSFDPADPWKSVWAMATHKDYEHFWNEEFVTPAMMVRLHLKRIGEVVDGDAPIDDARGPGTKPTAAASSTPGVIVDDVPTPPPLSGVPPGGRKTARGWRRERRGISCVLGMPPTSVTPPFKALPYALGIQALVNMYEVPQTSPCLLLRRLRECDVAGGQGGQGQGQR